MRWYNLDMVVRKLLLNEQKPIHYYLQYLSYACSGLQKLNIQTLKVVNSKQLPVTPYKAVQLPIDYMDWVQVGIKVGEKVRPMIYDDSITSLYNIGSDGRKKPHENTLSDGSVAYNGDEWVATGSLDTPQFGRSVDRDDYKFKVLPRRGEHGEIQLSASYPYDFVILDYITDGLEADAATTVDPLAVEAIEMWIKYQVKLNSRSASEGEKQMAKDRFDKAHRDLRAAKNGLTKEEIIAAVRSGYGALPRN